MDTALAKLKPVDLADPDTRAWRSAATMFQWGKPTIELSQADQKRIANKLRDGKSLSPGEQMWLDASQIDTDMF